MKKLSVLTILLALALFSAACTAMNVVTGGDSGLKPVAQLWSDVPRMDGLASSQLEMPLFAKLLMRTILNQVTGEGKDTGDWVAFTTSKTPADVQTFYTNARRQASGWHASENSTCLSGSNHGIPQVGVFCVFQKSASTKNAQLLIIASQDDQTKQTNVFFVRVEELATPVPNP